MKEFLPEGIMETIYHGLVESTIEYGISIYGNASKNKINKIDSLQKSILKSVHYENRRRNAKFNSYRDGKILTTKNLFYRRLIINNYFNREKLMKVSVIHNHETRQISSGNYRRPKTNNKYGDRLRTTTVTEILNKMTTEMKNLSKMSELKRKVKEWLLQREE